MTVPMSYNDTRVVDLDYVTGSSGSQLLELVDVSMMWDTDIYLEDIIMGTIIDFKLAGNYEFNSQVNDDPKRFKLHFVNLYTGTTNPEWDTDIVVYSNDGSIYINNKLLQNMDYKVVDLLGRVVVSGSTDQYTHQINTLKRKQYYLIQIINDGINKIHKVYLE